MQEISGSFLLPCPKCGHESTADTKFCPYCGKKLKSSKINFMRLPLTAAQRQALRLEVEKSQKSALQKSAAAFFAAFVIIGAAAGWVGYHFAKTWENNRYASGYTAGYEKGKISARSEIYASYNPSLKIKELPEEYDKLDTSTDNGMGPYARRQALANRRVPLTLEDGTVLGDVRYETYQKLLEGKSVTAPKTDWEAETLNRYRELSENLFASQNLSGPLQFQSSDDIRRQAQESKETE